MSIIALLLILLGYSNYNLNEKHDVLEVASQNAKNEVNLGDVELVNSEPVIIENEEYATGIVSNDDFNNSNTSNIKEESSEVCIKEENYFEETKIERNRMYSETLETYQKLIDSNQTPEEQKAIAAQEITNITNKKNGIIIAENLIKNKGFENVVILENNGNVSVIVKSSNLTQEQISKIQNIVERELNVEIININISNK